METLWHALDWALGLSAETKSLTIAQVALRSLLIYGAGWLMLRLARTRLMSRDTAFDIVLGFVLGSTLSRGINGTAPLFTSIAAAIVLVALHQLLAWVSFRFRRAGEVLNGHAETVIRDGHKLEKVLAKNRLSDADLDEELRLNAHLADPGKVLEGRIERNGMLSVIKHREVVDIQVHEGVQIVRIEIG